MPIWPYEVGEFRYCPHCGDVWRVARRGQHNPKTGAYRPSVGGDKRTRCTCGPSHQGNDRLKPRLVPMPDQDACEAAYRIGGDDAVRGLVPPAKTRPYEPMDRRTWLQRNDICSPHDRSYVERMSRQTEDSD